MNNKEKVSDVDAYYSEWQVRANAIFNEDYIAHLKSTGVEVTKSDGFFVVKIAKDDYDFRNNLKEARWEQMFDAFVVGFDMAEELANYLNHRMAKRERDSQFKKQAEPYARHEDAIAQAIAAFKNSATAKDPASAKKFVCALVFKGKSETPILFGLFGYDPAVDGQAAKTACKQLSPNLKLFQMSASDYRNMTLLPKVVSNLFNSLEKIPKDKNEKDAKTKTFDQIRRLQAVIQASKERAFPFE